MTVGGGRREVVAAPAPKNLAGALQASTPFSFFLANRAVAATGWPEKSNGSAVADPLAGERLRPCASAPPSSGFAAVLEPAREHPPMSRWRSRRLLSLPRAGEQRRGSEPQVEAVAHGPGEFGGPFVSRVGVWIHCPFRFEIECLTFCSFDS